MFAHRQLLPDHELGRGEVSLANIRSGEEVIVPLQFVNDRVRQVGTVSPHAHSWAGTLMCTELTITTASLQDTGDISFVPGFDSTPGFNSTPASNPASDSAAVPGTAGVTGEHAPRTQPLSPPPSLHCCLQGSASCRCCNVSVLQASSRPAGHLVPCWAVLHLSPPLA